MEKSISSKKRSTKCSLKGRQGPSIETYERLIFFSQSRILTVVANDIAPVRNLFPFGYCDNLKPASEGGA